jgi:putative spermidine/putrescine transport system permease protein
MTIRTDHNGSTGNARRSGAASGTARAPRTARTPWGTRLAELAMLAPTVTALALLFGGGLAGAIRQSLHPTIDASGPLHPSAWTAVLHDPAFLDALRFSLRTALVATGLSAALAIPIASALRHRGMLPRFLVMLPVPVPHLLVAVVAVAWLAPGGLAERILGTLPAQLIRDRAGLGILLVYLYKETPFLVLLLLARMGAGLRRREEAAAVLGATRWQRLRWVVWPTIRAPLSAGALIVAAFVLGALEVPLAVGPSYPPTLATYALDQTQLDLVTGQARAAVALLVAAATSIVLAVAAVRLARGAGDA